mgnify:CR=1 FL=1
MIGFDSLRSARPQPSSRFMHRKPETMKQARDEYTYINVETQMWEKPRQSTNCRIHYGRGIQQRGYTEATTSCPLLRHTRRLQLRQRPHTHTLSFSLSLSHAVSVHTRYTTTYNKSVQQLKMCALSHIYTYMTFGLFTYLSPSNRSGRIGTGSSEPGLRSSGSP